MKSFLTTAEITFFSFFICISGLAFSQDDTNHILARTWKVEKQSISGIVIKSNPATDKDFLQLNKNFTFTRVDEGICYTGRWYIDNENKKIKLNYDLLGRETLFKIESYNDEKLVLKIEEDWKNEMLMYFSAVKYPCSI